MHLLKNLSLEHELMKYKNYLVKLYFSQSHSNSNFSDDQQYM